MASMTIREQKLWAVQAEVNNFMITRYWSIYFERLEFSWGFYKDKIQQWKYNRIIPHVIEPVESTVDSLLMKTWLSINNISVLAWH